MAHLRNAMRDLQTASKLIDVTTLLNIIEEIAASLAN
jgi:hypothetical protein